MAGYHTGMRRLFLGAFLAIPLAASARAETAVAGSLERAKQSGVFAAASTTNEESAREAGAIFEGGRSAAPAVQGGESLRRTNLYASPGVSHSGSVAPPGPQLPASAESKGKWPPWAMYAAGGGLGFLQGALFGGLLGGIGGAAIGLATSHFYIKDKPEVSLGISAGSIIGSFMGGPIGALAGAVVGGLVGWLVGKLF